MFPIIKDNKSTWPWVTPKLLLTCLQAWRGHKYFMKSQIILAICSIQKKKIILTFNFQIHFTFRQITNFSFKSSDFTIFSILISRFNLKMIPMLHEFHSLNLMKPQQPWTVPTPFLETDLSRCSTIIKDKPRSEKDWEPLQQRLI